MVHIIFNVIAFLKKYFTFIAEFFTYSPDWFLPAGALYSFLLKFIIKLPFYCKTVRNSIPIVEPGVATMWPNDNSLVTKKSILMLKRFPQTKINRLEPFTKSIIYTNIGS